MALIELYISLFISLLDLHPWFGLHAGFGIHIQVNKKKLNKIQELYILIKM